EEADVGGAGGKIAAAPDPQRLIDGHLEAMVGLLDIAVLVGDAGVVGRRGQAVMGHQRGVALGHLGAARVVEGADRGAEVIGPMLLWDAAKLPEATLEPLGQRLEALGEAEVDRLDVRVGEDQVEDEVREGDAGEGDPQVGHVGEVRLGNPPRLVHLGEDHLLVWTVLGPPEGDLALEGAQLVLLVVARPPGREHGKQGRALQGRIPFELGTNPGPVLLERVGPGAIGAGRLELAGELAQPLIRADRPDAHPGSGRCLILGLAFGAFALHQSYLRIALHGASSSDAMVGRFRRDHPKRQFSLSPQANLIVAQHQGFIRNGVARALDDFVARDKVFDVKDFPEVSLKVYQANGKQYAFPYDHGPHLLWYNRDLFQREGVKLPDSSWTMDDFAEAARKLTKPNGEQWGMAGFNPGGYPMQGTYLGGWGARYLNDEETEISVDSKEAIQALEFWVDLRLRRHYSPLPAA